MDANDLLAHTRATDRLDRADNARAILTRLGIPLGADFHALPNAQVDALLERARAERYRPHRNANGSRARYYHERLQRLAAREGK